MPRLKKSARRPVKRQRLAGLTVTIQRSNHRSYSHLVVVRKDGRRMKQRYAVTEDEAKTIAEELSIETGVAGAKAATKITDSDKRFLMDARESLAAHGKTLRDAVDFYLGHLKIHNASKPLREAVDALLLHRQKKGKSDRYQKDLQNRLGRFEVDFPDRMIGHITSDEVERWLDALQLSSVSQNNYRRVLSVLWGFAQDKGWAAENIITRIEGQTVRAERPRILSIEQVRALLGAASHEIVPYLAIALFGGLRDAELKRLVWRDVSLLTGYIRISATVSKTNRERLVPITENLKAWLQPVAAVTGMVTPKNWRPLLEKAREGAKIKDWPHDATRHSFGTYEMARTKDIGHVSEVMGNSPAVVQRHYKAAVPFELGDQFFSIVPAVASNIMPMVAA